MCSSFLPWACTGTWSLDLPMPQAMTWVHVLCNLQEEITSWIWPVVAAQALGAQSFLCMCSLGECVSVNFGQHPFKFSVEAMIQEEDDRQGAAVQR